MTNFAQDLLATRHGAPCLELPGGRVWSYSDLRARTVAFSRALEGLGLEPGDRVLVQVEKSPDAVALYLATLSCGAVFVPLNVAYTRAEVEYFQDDSEARLLVCTPERFESLRPVAERAGAQIRSLGTASWRTTAGAIPSSAEGGGADADLLGESVGEADSSEATACIVERQDSDLAAIVYTSGTTGRSKGAMLTHGNLRSNARVLCEHWAITGEDVLIHALPIFHVHGLFVALHTLLLAGGKVRFLPKFDADTVRAELARSTVLMGVPTFYTRLLALEDFGREDCAHMRLFISGSAPLLASTHDEFATCTGHRVLERYGMSETGMITSNPLDGERLAGTVGFALPGVEIRVCDRESGRRCETGEIGTVEVRGPNVFAGYWRQPQKTAEEHREDGFFITGDLGFLDEDGRLTLVGRDKDLVISGGYNIYPKEIEDVLDAVPGVLESAVIGVPHRDLGEGLVAVLVALEQPVPDESLQRALDEKLARFKHPRRFEWLAELPRNAMGKVQKKVLREQLGDSYASQ